MSRAKKFIWQNKPVSVLKLIPNILTIVGLCIGFSSVRFALDAKWEQAVLCIIVAAIVDGIDGKVARLLNATSVFGAELDSLCDFINFGVAPVLVTYLWLFNEYSIKLISWGSILFFSTCMALRLARFNTMAISVQENKALRGFFVGIPAPAGGILALLPLICEFDLSEYLGFSFRSHPLFLALYQSVIAILMASRIPTISLKDISVLPHNLWLLMLSTAIIVIALFLYTWIILPIFAVLYLCSFPFSYLSVKKISASFVNAE